jgi:hypothetical protein
MKMSGAQALYYVRSYPGQKIEGLRPKKMDRLISQLIPILKSEILLGGFLKIPPIPIMGTFGIILGDVFRKLKEAKLIQFYKDGYKITDRWTKIQIALELSLEELAQFSLKDAIIVKPNFGIPEKPVTRPEVVAIMPFSKKFSSIYETHIKAVAKRKGLSIARADNFFANTSIIDDIWTLILGAKVIVADCTDQNPNVFYELGIAHTLGKDVILLTQSMNDIPFDISHLRYIEYENTPIGIRKLEKSLDEALQFFTGKPNKQLP